MNENIFLKSILLLLPITLSCTGYKDAGETCTLIDIESNIDNMRQINLSQFSDDIEYIPLEKGDTFFLNGIYKYDFRDTLVFLSDFQQCVLFDRKGNFITRIANKGRGPGEYEAVSDIVIGKNGKLYIQSTYDLFEYDLSGRLLMEYKKHMLTKNDYISKFYPIEENLYFGNISHSTGHETYKALIFNLDNDSMYFFRNYIHTERQSPLAAASENEASIFHSYDGLYFKQRYNDTLFFLNEKNRLIPVYYFKLGKFTLPLFTGGREDLSNYVSTIRNYIWINSLFKIPNYIFIDCQFNSHFPAQRITPKELAPGIVSSINTSSALGIYDKTTKELVFCQPTSTDNPLFTSGLFNDIDAGPRFYPQKMVDDSTMVMCIEAKQFKDHIASDDFKKSVPKYPEKKRRLEELAGSLSEFDNPVLMFVTFRK